MQKFRSDGHEIKANWSETLEVDGLGTVGDMKNLVFRSWNMGASKKYMGTHKSLIFVWGVPSIWGFPSISGNPIYLFYVEYGRSPIDKEFSRAS